MRLFDRFRRAKEPERVGVDLSDPESVGSAMVARLLKELNSPEYVEAKRWYDKQRSLGLREFDMWYECPECVLTQWGVIRDHGGGRY